MYAVVLKTYSNSRQKKIISDKLLFLKSELKTRLRIEKRNKRVVHIKK